MEATTPTTIKNNEIIYTSVYGKKIRGFEYSRLFGQVYLVSHTYENGIGNAIYDGDVTKIGYEAFYECQSLSSITLPNSVTSIDADSFCGCSSLANIVLPKSLTIIGCSAFDDCITLHSKLSQSGRYFKAFNADMTCRGFKYEEGKDYHCDNIKLCKQGFHYCSSILELFNYYSGEEDKDIVIHEVFPSGEIIKQNNSTMHCCSDIRIGRRIKFSEIGDIVSEILNENNNERHTLIFFKVSNAMRFMADDTFNVIYDDANAICDTISKLRQNEYELISFDGNFSEACELAEYFNDIDDYIYDYTNDIIEKGKAITKHDNFRDWIINYWCVAVDSNIDAVRDMLFGKNK